MIFFPGEISLVVLAQQSTQLCLCTSTLEVQATRQYYVDKSRVHSTLQCHNVGLVEPRVGSRELQEMVRYRMYSARVPWGCPAV